MSRFRKSFVWGWILVTGCGGSTFMTSPDGGGGGPDAGQDGASGVDASDGGGDGPGACPTKSIDFVLQVAGGSIQSFCNGGPGCALGWLTIVGPGGTALSLGAPCATDCNKCQPIACPLICAVSSPIPQGGLQQSWDGTVYDSSTCGAGISCTTPDCAAAGSYTAHMCAYATDAAADASFGVCTGSTPTCVDVPFVWPPASAGTVVRGTVGSPGGSDGACCPTGWDLYSCAWPDGGAGLACHDPSKGCASSSVCGQGCDSVVMGRCDGG
jgi:hypothetical protein